MKSYRRLVCSSTRIPPRLNRFRVRALLMVAMMMMARPTTDVGEEEDFREFLGRFGPHAGLAAGRCRLMIALMTERSVIACCVSSETKARVRALAEREGITESTFVRQLL